MQTPTPKLASETLRKLGRWHSAALDQFDETRPLAEGFQPVQDDLIAAAAQVQSADDALLSPRMAVMLSEMGVEKVHRQIDGAARLIDGKQHGPTSQALMPKGLNATVQPVGQRQVTEADELLQRAETHGLVTNETLAPLFADLRTKAGALQTALDRRKEAYRVRTTARTAEMICRADFCTAYSREMGLIRSIFPDDRKMQELFFDIFKHSAKEEAEEEGGATTEGGS